MYYVEDVFSKSESIFSNQFGYKSRIWSLNEMGSVHHTGVAFGKSKFIYSNLFGLKNTIWTLNERKVRMSYIGLSLVN